MAIDVELYYRRYGPMVMRRCRRLLSDEDEAMDAMQDVFVKLMEYEQRLSDDAPSSLLYRIATNVCLNKIRSRKSRPEPANADEDLLNRIADTEDVESRGMARVMLDKVFKGRRESTRVIAVMHLLEGMTLEEISAEVGLSVSGVLKRLRTLKSQIKEVEGV